MDLAPSINQIFQKPRETRRNPLLYRLQWPNLKITVSVPGHYETPCGGCDTIKTYDQLFEIIRAEHATGHHVLFEGLLVAHDKLRCRGLWDWLERKQGTFAIIELTESLETCLASVEARRNARKNPPKKPFNPDNTIRRYREVVRSCEQLEAEGIPIYRCKREEVLGTVQSLLRIPLVP